MTPEFIAGVVGLLGLLGGIWKVWSIIEGKITEARKSLEKEVDRQGAEVEAARAQLAAWQLEIVRSYATKAELDKLENRIVAAIERLELKLEGYFKAAE